MGEVAIVVVQSSPNILLVGLRGFGVFLFALGVVYILGRMLEVLRCYRTKNFIAFGCMLLGSYVVAFLYDLSLVIHPAEFYMRMAMYVAVAAIFYVLIGFDLYDRFNAWSDKKIAKAPPKPTPKPRNKRTKT